MTTPASSSDPAAVAVELERIRRTIEVGFTRTDGALALLMQRHDQTDEQIREHTRRLDEHDVRLDVIERGETERQKRNDARVDALERARWPLASVVVLVGVLGLAVSLWEFTTR
ncbi:hypothetical protein [Streptomyces jumonjinensis]|uniref:Uncharacterized protein n=1 Tax=Streptomyces jumonjinensis TaxID=1945 RepID=A0A646KP54_STRJU|nr:hypothetical protein [Streptomyces jumonjinensis]MQT03848.1 hypothetical protein [Streptomyces jumonjinensis]